MKPSEYLKDHWWHGGVPDKGQECISTVFARAGIDFVTWRRTLIKIIGCSNGFGIYAWNDSPERTLEEVLAVAREAENLVLGNTK